MFDRNDSLRGEDRNNVRFARQGANPLRSAAQNPASRNLPNYSPADANHNNGNETRLAGGAQVHDLPEHGKVVARSAQFPEVSFTHMTLSATVMNWKRDQPTVAMATMVFLLHGHVEISTANNKILKRRPGVFLIPPDTGDVVFKTSAPTNELIGVSLSSRLFATILPDYKTYSMMGQNSKLDVVSLQPLLAFVVSACNLNNQHVQMVNTLETVANDVARSLLIACFGQGMSVMPLIERVRKYVAENYTDSALSVTKTAEHENVSVRTVQLALQEADTNFTALVRRARTEAALELRKSQPSLTLVEIGDRCGFGSVSSLRRALKIHEEMEDDGDEE
ncbi:helix-turn-helix domain-containing protein [Bifidobacterium sp. ESL0745]|uniref:helix-turn-helix domain-containing protein n=1 Tax=Bifidobacterium sp. ESL0745 TaxID=2983226 RepID=UPI0023F80822|nr:helix-turn-helix domain-containing protein [Bifidobacterium sp. ESL0745]MDF7665968.1 helix-turn-helix domain-containing protein [Bifidobacterium sp. ESL0745]